MLQSDKNTSKGETYMRKTKRFTSLAAIAMLGLVAAACGDDNNSSSSTAAPAAGGTTAPAATSAPGGTTAPAGTTAASATTAPAGSTAPAGTGPKGPPGEDIRGQRGPAVNESAVCGGPKG